MWVLLRMVSTAATSLGDVPFPLNRRTVAGAGECRPFAGLPAPEDSHALRTRKIRTTGAIFSNGQISVFDGGKLITAGCRHRENLARVTLSYYPHHPAINLS